MKRADITQALNDLNLPKGTYVVIGSGILAALEIRDTSDIDLVVSPETIADLMAQGWKVVANSWGKQLLTHDVFEADISWDDPDENPNLESLLETSQIIEGIPYVSLERVLEWKRRMRRPKDEADIPLIEAYLHQHVGD